MLTTLPITAPPTLEAALGIPDTGAVVFGLFWGSDGHLKFTDGRLFGPCHQDASLLFVSHPAVFPIVDPLGLGATERSTDHWLVLNRPNRRLHVSPTSWARSFLHNSAPSWIPFVVLDPPPNCSTGSATQQMVDWLDALIGQSG